MFNVYQTEIGPYIIKAQDLKNGDSGMYDDPCLDFKLCTDRSHEPPSHLCIPEGKVYKHVCPSCKKEAYIRPLVIYSMQQ